MVFMYFALSCWNFTPYLCGHGSVLISIRERGKVPEPGVCFGNVRLFHGSALNLLAGSLDKCPNPSWDKVYSDTIPAHVILSNAMNVIEEHTYMETVTPT